MEEFIWFLRELAERYNLTIEQLFDFLVLVKDCICDFSK